MHQALAAVGGRTVSVMLQQTGSADRMVEVQVLLLLLLL